MITVTISDKGGQQSRLEFNKSEISIGRMKGNDIVLPKGNVSKRHASIYVRDSMFFVNDHGSTNGTYINGRKVNAEHEVSGEDKIYIGDFILQLDANAGLGAGMGGAPSGPPSPPIGGSNRTIPPVPKPGGIEGNRAGNDTLFDPFGSDIGGGDPLRQTYTTPPPSDAFGEESADSSPMRKSYPGNNVPEGVRDTIGAHEELQQVGPPPRKFDAVPYTPPNPTPPGPPEPRPGNGGSSPGLNVGAGHSPSPSPPPATGGMGPSPRPERPDMRQAPLAPERAPVSNIAVQAPEVSQEFDSDFFVAQLDVARVLFDKNPLAEMPLAYPALDEDRERYERAVDDAIKEINPGVDQERLKELLVAECVDLGPIDRYLNDHDVRDIYINRYDQILVQRRGELIQAEHVFSTPDTLDLVARRLLGDDADVLGADEIRFGDGTRVHVVMPPLAVDGPLITIRKPPIEHPSIQDLVEQGVLSVGMADFLMRAIDAGRSIAVAGPTSSGKTTLLSALAGLIYEGMRIISIEDYSHIELPQGSAVRMEANPSAGYDKRFLLRNALAMHPQRILLDECRGAEAYDWVTAVASGTEGSMLTVHGTSAADALGRLESLCLLGSHEVSPRGLREQIARAVNLVVVVNRINNEGFRVQQITEVQGVDLDTFRLNDIFYYRVEGAEGAFHPTGYIPLFYEDLRNAGVSVDFDIFQE